MMQIKPDTQAALALAIARLRSMRAIECLGALLVVTALIGAALSTGLARILFSAAVLAAMFTFYSCIRVRIDVALFERWEHLDSSALDQALLAVNPNFKPGRTLESRIAGSLGWWRRGVVAWAMQLALCLAAVLLR